MKKRLIIMLLTLFILTGCVSVNDVDIDTLINSTSNSKYNLYNHINSGYKYYLPRELTAMVNDEYNEIIKGNKNTYYLYVDLVAYYNKKESLLEEDESLYFSKLYTKDDINGIVNIKEDNGEYIIKVYYKYASVQVRTLKKHINECLTNALIIVNSITYNDDVVKNILNESEFSTREEAVNIFDNKRVDDDSLNVDENTYSNNEEGVYDPDVITKRG